MTLSPSMDHPTKVQCVVVLYKSTFEASATLNSLKAVLAARPDLVTKITLLVYDNSPSSQEEQLKFLAPQVTAAYQHDPANGGLAAAYNVALGLANQKGIKWLLLLDQDTEITGELLPALFHEIENEPAGNVCALVPQQRREGKILSPTYRDHPVQPGIATEPLIVYNSAATLRVQALNMIGGFPMEFRLDYLDHIVFHRLQRHGDRVLVLAVSLEHQLSILNLEAEMSVPRYTNLLVAEWAYIREVKPRGYTIPHRVRLMRRSWNQLKMKDRSYALHTFQAVFSLGSRKKISGIASTTTS